MHIESLIKIEVPHALLDCQDQIPQGATIVAELGIDLESVGDLIVTSITHGNTIDITKLGYYNGPDPSELPQTKAVQFYEGENLNIFWYTT